MIVVFDGQCLLCMGAVRFLLKHDRNAVFQFASVQGQTGRFLLDRAGLKPEELQTFLLVDGEKAWQQTAAIFRVGDGLGWPWRLAWIGWFVPAPLRDAAYRWVARNRVRLFGRSDVCFLPSPDVASRFLD